MANENHFVYNPSTVDIGRSKFLINSYWKGSIYHGDLVPVEITRVMPGDSAKYDISAFIRTATPPIAPFLDTIRLSFAAFYVPERLVWDKEKEFLGENREGYGIQTSILAPRSSNAMFVGKNNAATTNKRSIATYLGLVAQNIGTITNRSQISLNPVRAFLQVYNDWFRNENFMAPYLWAHDQTGDSTTRVLASLNGSNVFGTSDLPKVCKQLDRFTSCLPWAQKGAPVLLPLGSSAPVGVVEGSQFKSVGLYSNTASKNWAWNKGGADVVIQQTTNADGGNLASNSFAITEDTNAALVSDLSQATAASVNQLRLAFATQRYLEQLARSGSKYREYIKGMFGVNIGDTTAQMSEYLGGMTVELNIDQVLQTTGFAAGGSTTLGAPGASSTSAASGYLFTKSFTEPGFLVVVAYTKHNRSYGQGLDEIYQKHDLLEEYNPKFANIGEQAIKTNSIYFDGDASKDDDRFGFQEAWSEYKNKRDMIVGELCPSNTNAYNFWSLADNYASAPQLAAAFLTEDRSSIARCLSGGEASADYFLDIKFKRVFVRPMPLYDIPGLIDHH